MAAGYRKKNQNKVPMLASSYIYTHVQLPILRLDGERYTVVVSNRGRVARCRAAVPIERRVGAHTMECVEERGGGARRVCVRERK